MWQEFKQTYIGMMLFALALRQNMNCWPDENWRLVHCNNRALEWQSTWLGFLTTTSRLSTTNKQIEGLLVCLGPKSIIKFVCFVLEAFVSENGILHNFLIQMRKNGPHAFASTCINFPSSWWPLKIPS